MYVRWIRNPVREASGLREDVLCFHVGPSRYALSPQVIESYRDAIGTVRKRLLWTPGRSLRTCCAQDVADPVPRVLWWLEVNDRIDELRRVDNGPARRLLAELSGLLQTLAKQIPLPSTTDSVFAEAWSSGAGRTRQETLRGWYERCWNEAQAQLKQQAPDPTVISREEAWALFDLAAGFTETTLKQAYRKAALAAHPDRDGGSHARFLRVGAAYDLLRQPFDSTA